MWKPFLTWLLKFVLERLGSDLDAEMKAELAAYEQKRAEVEAARELSEIELGRIEQARRQLETQRHKNQVDIDWIADVLIVQDQRIKELNDRKKQKLDEINRLGDDDLLRGELP